eukprot:scaffold2562_cov116-Isochrysis_galbana.AAC.6
MASGGKTAAAKRAGRRKDPVSESPARSDGGGAGDGSCNSSAGSRCPFGRVLAKRSEMFLIRAPLRNGGGGGWLRRPGVACAGLGSIGSGGAEGDPGGAGTKQSGCIMTGKNASQLSRQPQMHSE